MTVKLILLGCVYPFVLFMYVLLKNELAPKKGLWYGVTLTKEQAAAPEVEQITKNYQKQMRLGLLAILLVPVPAVLLPWFSVFMIVWTVWLLASTFVFFIPFGKANTALKELKRQKGWKKNGIGERVVEIKSAGAVRKVKWYHFLPQSILSLAAFGWALVRFWGDKLGALSVTIGSFAFITVFFWLAAVWMDRQRTQVISSNSEVNLNYARAKKNLWKNMWVICAWINTVYTVALLRMLDSDMRLTGFFAVSAIIYTVAVLAVLIWVLNKKKKLDKTYRDKMDMMWQEDEDNWIWGMIYYNPKDKRSSVESRTGFGITTNMAKPAGKLLIGFVAVVTLQLILVCMWVVLLEFTPISLRVEDTVLVASQINEDYRIPVSIIEEVTLLDEKPKWEKVSGTGMDTLHKGTFRIYEEGSCEAFLNPQNGVFIRFEAAGTTYYMSGYDDEETLKVYEELVK